MKKTTTEKTGYPSVDKPWLKYYSESACNLELPECTLYDYLYQNNCEHMNDYALDYFGKKYTFKSMFENIEIVSKALSTNGVKAGDVVSIVTVSSVISILLFYAINKIGAISNYINVLSTEEDLKKYYNDAQSKLVITLDVFIDNVVNAAKDTCVERIVSYSLAEYMPLPVKIGYTVKTKKKKAMQDNVITWKEFIDRSSEIDKVDIKKDPKSVCYYGHTGGTTGFPKTVLLNDCQMNAVAHQYRYSFTHKRGDVFLYVTIPFVVYGILTCMHMPLSLGCCIAIIPKYSPKDWPMYFTKYKPNHIATVPSFIAPMLDDARMDKIDFSMLKTMCVGGDGMSNELEQRVNSFLAKHNSKCVITKGYGMSETGAAGITEFDYAHKLGSIGIPLVKSIVKIVNTENGDECKYNETGEVCISSPSRMIGYKDNEEETKRFSKVHKDGIEWVHTGDLGYVDEDGFVYLMGRIKRLILTTANGAGYKVAPSIPEEIIMKHKAVKNVCIIGAMDGVNQVLRACVILESGYDKDEDVVEKELRDICAKNLAEYSCPTFYNFMGSFPVTSAGKIDYRKLEENMLI